MLSTQNEGPLVCIDWISPAAHKNFNLPLFSLFPDPSNSYYYFFKDLSCAGPKNFFISSGSGRIKRFFEVFKIVWKNKENRLVLITYDPLFVPFILFLKRKIFCFEHNTVPERPRYYKHAIWQFIFTRRLIRMTTSKEQIKTLLNLRQNAKYVGVPLSADLKYRAKLSLNPKKTFLIPSYRTQDRDLLNIKDLINGAEIIVKKDIDLSDHIINLLDLKKISLDYIDLEENSKNIMGVLISGQSEIRLSGWISESISHGLTIISCSKNIDSMIANNYPNFRYISSSGNTSINALISICDTNIKFNLDLVASHNANFCKRVLNCFEDN